MYPCLTHRQAQARRRAHAPARPFTAYQGYFLLFFFTGPNFFCAAFTQL
jgi:hypothetical protein